MEADTGIVGYVDPLVCSPGAKVAVKVSCHRPSFTSQLCRLGAGYAHPDAPPVGHQVVGSVPKESHEGKPQYSRIGSYAIIDDWDCASLAGAEIVTVSFWCQPTLLVGAGHDQYLFSSFAYEGNRGFELFVTESGQLRLRVGKDSHDEDHTLLIESPELVRHDWLRIEIEIRAQTGSVTVTLGGRPQQYSVSEPKKLESWKPFIIGSDSRTVGSSLTPQKSGTFNGKIEDFRVQARRDDTLTDLLALNFSLDISTNEIRDTENRIHGRLVNAPSRAVIGHDWDPSLSDWTHATYGYAAIHFHDDDLDDAMWDTTFDLDVPANLKSGCYGILVEDGSSSDFIPLFVRPDLQAKLHPPVALIIPTFTYTGKIHVDLYLQF